MRLREKKREICIQIGLNDNNRFKRVKIAVHFFDFSVILKLAHEELE